MEPKAYRKKPVVISALEYVGGPDNLAELERWGVTFMIGADGLLKVATLEGGGHDLREGDMICRGVKGEFYPCRPDIFALTYDEA